VLGHVYVNVCFAQLFRLPHDSARVGSKTFTNVEVVILPSVAKKQ